MSVPTSFQRHRFVLIVMRERFRNVQRDVWDLKAIKSRKSIKLFLINDLKAR